MTDGENLDLQISTPAGEHHWVGQYCRVLDRSLGTVVGTDLEAHLECAQFDPIMIRTGRVQHECFMVQPRPPERSGEMLFAVSVGKAFLLAVVVCSFYALLEVAGLVPWLALDQYVSWVGPQITHQAIIFFLGVWFAIFMPVMLWTIWSDKWRTPIRIRVPCPPPFPNPSRRETVEEGPQRLTG